MDRYLYDKRTIEKSPSESNLAQGSKSDETTPPNFIYRRGKRERENEWHSDFMDFKAEMKTMMGALISDQEKELKKFFSPTLTEIQKTNQNIESSIALLMSKNEELTKRVAQLEQQKKKDGEYILTLENRIEDIQRNGKKNSIELKNVSKNKTESKDDLVKMVVRLGKTIDCNIDSRDINDIFRVRGKKVEQNAPVIVELSSTILKTDVLKKSKLFNVKNKSKLRAKHLGFTKDEETPVFVSEQLTVKGSRLYYLARDLAKSKNYKFCWTSYGRVYVREHENAPIITISNENQVTSLMQAA